MFFIHLIKLFEKVMEITRFQKFQEFEMNKKVAILGTFAV